VSAYTLYAVIKAPPLSSTSNHPMVIDVAVDLRYIGAFGFPGTYAALI